MPGGGRVVVVVGACGGVGASTFAALLAQEARRAGVVEAGGGRSGVARVGGGRSGVARVGRGRRGVALVDVDGAGPGIEVLLGIEDAPGVRWADLADLRGSLTPEDVDGVLPVWRGVEVLGGDRRGGQPAAEAFRTMWPALVGRSRTVVLDVPAHALDVLAGGLGGAAPQVVVVTGQDVRGVAGGLTTLAALGARDAPVPTQLMLRRRRAARVAPLEAAQVLDLPLLGVLPTDRRLAEATDRGFGPITGRRSGLARAVAAAARGCGVVPRAVGRTAA